MIESVGRVLELVSVVTGSVSFVGLFLRLPRLWLPTRARAIRVWVASFVLLLIGFALQGLMAEVRTLLVLVSVVTGSVSFVGLFLRRPRLWFPTRTRAFLVLVASVGLFFIGGGQEQRIEVGRFLGYVSVVAGSVSLVGLFLRRPRPWFPTRTRAFLVLVASVGLFFIGGVLMAPHFQGWGGDGFGIVVLESLEAQEEQEAVPLPEDPDAMPLGR